MSRFRKSRVVVFALGAPVFLNSAAAWADDPTASQPSQQQVLDRINSLQSEVDQLKQIAKQQQEQQRLIEANANETASAELKRETEGYGRLQLNQEGFTAGYDANRFVIQSSDGRFVLRPWLQLQARYETTYRDDAQHNGRDPDTQSGFEIRRLKFGFDGNAISPNLTYLLQLAVDRKTGTVSLEQAYGKYRIDNTPFYVKAGQYKEPLDHEQLVPSRYLTALDRTLTDDLFINSEGFVQGISGGFDNGGPVRAEVAFTDGQRSANTNFEQFSVGGNTADYGAAGRLDFKLFGNWKDYDNATGAFGVKRDFLVAGAGADYTEAGDTHLLTHVADIDYASAGGLGLYAAYTGRSFSHAAIGSIGANGGTTGKVVGANGYDFSLRGQASYAIDAHWEPYVQYEYIHLDQDDLPTGAKNQIQVIRAGINYYLLNTLPALHSTSTICRADRRSAMTASASSPPARPPRAPASPTAAAMS